MLGKILAIITSMVLLAGCSVLSGKGDAGDQVAAKTAIQAGVMKYIGEDQSRANGVVEVVSKAEKLMKGDKATTVGELEQRIVQDVIEWDKMDAAERLVVKRTIESVRLRIEQEIEDNKLNPDTRVAVKNILAWVREAAVMSGGTVNGSQATLSPHGYPLVRAGDPEAL